MAEARRDDDNRRDTVTLGSSMTDRADCLTPIQAYDAMLAVLRRYVQEFNNRGSLEDFLFGRDYTELDEAGVPRTWERDAWDEWLGAIQRVLSSGEDTPTCLTSLQGYDAMVALLTQYVEEYRWRGTLHQFYLMREYADLDENGVPQTLEPAAWNEWLEAIETVLTERRSDYWLPPSP